MLNVIEQFFILADNKKVPYVQWKSNERLNLFLNGESDLDLLFFPENKKDVEQIFCEINAKKFEALPFGKYPNIDDYLVLDRETACLVHFHVHYQLDIGEPGVKRYPLPWLTEVIENRIRHETEPIWTVSYEHELLLLLVREALRIHPLKVRYLRRSHMIEAKSNSEFHWLKARVDIHLFEETSRILLADAPNAVNSLLHICENGLSTKDICYLWHQLKPVRVKYRTCSDFQTMMRLLKHRFHRFSNKFLKLFGVVSPHRRVNPRDGLIAAITGSDGSGKSTTVQAVAAIYSKKLDVGTVYLGLPKPEKSKYPILVKAVYILRLKRFWNLLVKKATMKKAIQMKKNGMLVLCDRFPQAEYPGIMDGPLSDEWRLSKNPLKKLFARYEANVFRSLQAQKIDLVIKLDVDAETSQKRGLLSPSAARKKTDILKNISFPEAEHISIIDTVKYGIDAVIIQTANEIWNKFK